MLPRHALSKAYELGQLAVAGHGKAVLQAFLGRLHQDTVFLGLRRDLQIPLQVPESKIPIQVRPLRPNDDLSFLWQKDDSPVEMLIRLGQRRLLRLNMPICYVAVTESGEVTYMQWLISSRQNERINEEMGDIYPALRPDEALLEGAYSVPAFRGKGIMASAMAQIAAKAQHLGARYVITFVEENNVASLKGCEKAGFAPSLVRRGRWRLFRRTITFSQLPSAEVPGDDLNESRRRVS